MARGWESKSVESQVDARAEREAAKTLPPALTEPEMERMRVVGGLQLSRQRILSELSCARGNRQTMLRSALQELDIQIAAMGSE